MTLKKVLILKFLFIALISVSIYLSPFFLTSTLKADTLNF
jgi:hypothetical protein